MSSGSKPGRDERLAVLLGHEAVRPVADHGRHVARAEEAVEAEVGRLEDRLDRRDDRDVVAEHAEVGDADLARLQQRHRGRRRGRLEARPRRTRRRGRGSRSAMRSASSGEYTKRTSAPRALASSRLPLLPGHAHHVAERREDDAGRLGDRDGVVDAAHRDHAHRAARPVHQLDLLGQHVLDAVAVDGVRVAAAHLHELEVVVAGELGDARDEAPGRRRVAVLVDEPHGDVTQSVQS